MNTTSRRRVVLVTGASSGIGEALARVLAAQGDTVALVARRQDRLDAVLADCRTTSPDSERWVADLADPMAAAALALSIWDHFDGIDVVINNAGAPMRRHATSLTMDEVERTMTTNYFSPVAITLAVLPRMLSRRSGTIMNVSSLGGRLGIATEAAYSGSKFALAGWSESLAMDLEGTGVRVQLVLPGAIDTEIWDQPDNDAPLYDGPKEPPSVIAQGMVDALESDAFEHYLPDMKAVVEMKTSDIDTFMAGMRAMNSQSAAGRRIVKALLFGAAPDPQEVRPTPGDELETMLAGIPFGLHEMDDARLARPDWVITKPILSGICGSDAKLVLGDFSTGDIDNPMAAFSSLPHVPGHEVVAEVVALGPAATGLVRRPTGHPQPLAHLRPPGHHAPVPTVRGGRPQFVLELHQGRPGRRRPRRGDEGRTGGMGRAPGGPRLHADPGARRHLQRGGGAGRPLLRLLPRHRPPSTADERSGPGLRRRSTGTDQRGHPSHALPGGRGRRRGTVRGPSGHGASVRGVAGLCP